MIKLVLIWDKQGEFMQGFGVSRDIIIKKLDKGKKLNWEELLDVFRGDDKAVAKAIHMLLMKLEGESRDLLVDLINEDFKIWPSFSLESEEIDPIWFNKWKFVCVNRETKRFLLNFVLEERSNNELLDKFKNSLIDDMLSK